MAAFTLKLSENNDKINDLLKLIKISKKILPIIQIVLKI